MGRYYIILVFSLGIFVPFLTGIAEKDQEISLIEKRSLAKFPSIPKNIKERKKISKKFESYYSDHFGERDFFIKYYKLIKYKIGDSPSNDVTIGKDGWLFLGSIKKGYKKYKDPIGDFRGKNLYSQAELKKFAEYMIRLNAWLQERNIKYVFIIAPNKHTIYFDKLPAYINKVNKQTATDQLVNYLDEHTDVSVIDLRDKLLDEKEKQEVYYKKGTHWNHYGANIAQYEIMRKINRFFPEEIHPKKHKVIVTSGKGGDQGLLNFIGIPKNKEINPKPLFEETCDPVRYPKRIKIRETHTLVCENKKIKAVIFRDSFMRALQPYFARNFKRSTYIVEKLNYPSLIKYIELEEPDIIIEEWVERSLPFVPESPHEFNYYIYKELFVGSNEVVFLDEFNRLRFTQVRVEPQNNRDKSIKLKSTKTPIVRFPLINFKKEHHYMMHLEIWSSVNSKLKLYYSDRNTKGHPFSGNRTVTMYIRSGDNDLYIPIYYSRLGKYLRLDPISGAGEVIIKTMEIKDVENSFNKES
ncbi:MAG: hypothetical protein D3917_08655 [Candidatus Electrothrix sp. AX5]|nr:hypothetical protein [Candidatus Electrothrix sp. AX5]